MKLFKLLKNVNCRVFGSTLMEIKGLYHKDTEVKEQGLFFCLRGTRVDGTEFVQSAIKNGAVAIVTEQEIPNLSKVTQVVVRNAREVMSLIACRFYGEPSKKLKVIAVTGTNGKTTITNMISNVLEDAGKKTAIVGTNGIFIKGKKYDTGMTTPDPIELQKYFTLMVKNKVEYVCMEVSAHAVYLNKVEGVRFECVVFSNLTQDHLDFFKNMENYFYAKSRLFSSKYSNFAVINADDFYGRKLIESINIPHVAYAIENDAEFKATNIKMSDEKQSFTLNNLHEFKLGILGKFNIYNTLAAACVLEKLDISYEQILSSFSQMQAVDGRFNTHLVKGRIVVIDYAHTPDGLQNILAACREIAGEKKVICMFGCGGNREVEKRKIMGEISSMLADFTVITSDNPRYESRESIAFDIEKGMKNKNYIIELDRSIAVKKAFEHSSEGDIVLLAGKGAENYIEENGMKIPYSDLQEIEKIRSE